MRLVDDVTQAVGEFSREHLAYDDGGLVQVFGWCDGVGDLDPVFGLVGVGGRVDEGFGEGQERVGVFGQECAGCGEGAAGVAVPNVAAEDMDEADAVEHGALVDRVWAEEAIDVVGA